MSKLSYLDIRFFSSLVILSRTGESDISTKSEQDSSRKSQRQVPFRLRRRSLSPTMRLESLMKDGNEKDDKQ